jgi:small-conductance mechanosensitive channel
MIILKHFVRVIICILLTTLAVSAQVAETSVIDVNSVIELQSTQAEDAQIETRIESIYAKIDAIASVEVGVESGVVTLAGDVANDALAIEAKDIALRTMGVVAVEDNINRTLDVRSNMAPVIEDLRQSLSAFTRALPLILLSVTVFIFFAFVGNRLAHLSGIWRNLTPNPFLAELLSQAVRLIILVVGAIIALNLLGASKFVTTILGGAGVIGIAIGFAVRDSMENYISSIMLSLRQPFRANDHVVINEHEGIVVRLTSRATILMTLEGNHLRIPNSVVFKGIILNYTTNPERRFDFELGVDAQDNPIAAMQVGLDAIKIHDFILPDPKPDATIKTVGDSNIVISFTAWVNQLNTDFLKARSLAIKSAMSALDEQGFTLPEPIYRLRFDAPIADVVGGSELETATTKTVSTPKSESAIELENLDLAPDTHLLDKVTEERSQDPENDLLDQARPKE